MSWICPYQHDDRCLRLKKECVPGQKGCVLRGKVKMFQSEKKKTGKKKN